MQTTRNTEVINAKAKAAFGANADLSGLVNIDDSHFLFSDVGFMAFLPVRCGHYSVVLGAAELGKPAKTMINDGFAWLFTRTNAYVVEGTIENENKACLAMAAQTLGYRLQRGDTVTFYKVTLARWAIAYGVEKALSEMRALGQAGKATKLATAIGGSA